MCRVVPLVLPARVAVRATVVPPVREAVRVASGVEVVVTR
jgi:hypothetical protein